jgi:hypothetical protein
MLVWSAHIKHVFKMFQNIFGNTTQWAQGLSLFARHAHQIMCEKDGECFRTFFS